MATSGNSDLTVTANQICSDAMKDVSALAAGETAEADDITDARRYLSSLVKQWMGTPNLLTAGLKMWKRRHLLIDLTATPDYILRFERALFTSGGTHEISRGDTLTGNTSSKTAYVSSVELTSGTWAGGDAAGELILLSVSGTFTAGENLNEGTNTNVATLTADPVQYGPPTQILTCSRRNSNGEDDPMSEMLLSEYAAIGDKDASGTPIRYYKEPKIDALNLYLDCKPSVTTDNLYMVALFPIEDFDALTDNPDFPREWFRPLRWNLAKELLTQYPVESKREKLIIGLAAESIGLANSFEAEKCEDYFQPGLD